MTDATEKERLEILRERDAPSPGLSHTRAPSERARQRNPYSSPRINSYLLAICLCERERERGRITAHRPRPEVSWCEGGVILQVNSNFSPPPCRREETLGDHDLAGGTIRSCSARSETKRNCCCDTGGTFTSYGDVYHTSAPISLPCRKVVRSNLLPYSPPEIRSHTKYMQ